MPELSIHQATDIGEPQLAGDWRGAVRPQEHRQRRCSRSCPSSACSWLRAGRKAEGWLIFGLSLAVRLLLGRQELDRHLPHDDRAVRARERMRAMSSPGAIDRLHAFGAAQFFRHRLGRRPAIQGDRLGAAARRLLHRPHRHLDVRRPESAARSRSSAMVSAHFGTRRRCASAATTIMSGPATPPMRTMAISTRCSRSACRASLLLFAALICAAGARCSARLRARRRAGSRIDVPADMDVQPLSELARELFTSIAPIRAGSHFCSRCSDIRYLAEFKIIR